MTKFKVGDRVCDAVRKDDIGVITRRGSFADSWFIKWETGTCKGSELWSEEDELELISTDSLDGTEIVIGGVTYILQRK